MKVIRRPSNFLFHLSSQFTRLSEYRSNSGLQACILVMLQGCQICGLAFRPQAYEDASFQYLDTFFKTTGQLSDVLILPVSVIILIILVWVYLSIVYLALDSMLNETKVNLDQVAQKRLRKGLCYAIDIIYWLPYSICYISLRLNNTQYFFGFINVLMYAIIHLMTIYYFRDFAFNRQGMYRSYSLLEQFRLAAIVGIVALYVSDQNSIQMWIQLLLLTGYIIDFMRIPFLDNNEALCYLLAHTSAFVYTALALMDHFISHFNQQNTLLLWMVAFPLLFAVLVQFSIDFRMKQLRFVRPIQQKEYNIAKYCTYLEGIQNFLQYQQADLELRLRFMEILKFHIENCLDVNCECREKTEKVHNRDWSQRDSMMSRTAILTIADNRSPEGDSRNSFAKSHREPTHKEIMDDDESRRIIKFAIKVHDISKPMYFIQNGAVDDEKVMLFIKYSFNQAIHAFQYTHNTTQLEIVSLKYITFMSAYKHNSPAALSRLKQVQGRNLNYSNFFMNVCAVLESQLIDDIKQRHPKIEHDEEILQVDEIWRLEQSKNKIVEQITKLLKAKMDMWENLSNGESSTQNKFIRDVIKVAKQLEDSRAKVTEIVEDFDKNVQHNYTYYHKYQCFQSLFFDADYKKAAMFQRRMEDAWSLSKASLRDGQLGNYFWLQGDIATLEVSISLLSGQILKGVNPRLQEFLGFKTLEDMEQQLKLRGMLSNSQSHSNFTQLSSLMPPFLTCSHSYFISRFLQRGYSPYISKPVESFVCSSGGFIVPVHIHLQYNFKNINDFTMLAALLRRREEEDYLIFDEWGRILGVTEKLFKLLIVKGSLEEFGIHMGKGGYTDKKLKVDRQEQQKQNFIQKIAHDDKASLFKKAITTNFNPRKTLGTTNSGAVKRRTYIKPSDLLIRFGSVQHFIPELAKQMTSTISANIFKQLQKESQAQMDKYFRTQTLGGMNHTKNEADVSKNLLKQISFMPDRSNSMGGQGFQSSMIDKAQYRTYIYSNFISPDGLKKSQMPILQDEKVTLYVPSNYNELIDYYNDAGEKYLDERGDADSRSYRRQNIQSKYSYLPQEQQTQHVFDAEFQDFIDTKVKRYYSKALLKEAIEHLDTRILDMVRYKTMATVEVGLGGTNDTDQFLYFVCKLTNMNLMTAKRKDVLKIHLKKDRERRYDGDPEMRKSLMELQSQDSFGNKRFSKQLSNSMLEVPKHHSSMIQISAPAVQKPEKAPRIQGSLMANSFNSLQRENSLKVNGAKTEEPAPTKKPFSFINRMKQQKEQKTEPAGNVILQVPGSDKSAFESGPQLKIQEHRVQQPVGAISDLSFDSSRDELEFLHNQPFSGKSQQQNDSQPPTNTLRVEDTDRTEESGQPQKKLNIGFLKKMENAFQKNKMTTSQTSSARSDDRKSSGGSFAGSFLTSFLSRLNMRRVSNMDVGQKDEMDNNPDMGFQEQSDESDSSKEKTEKKDDDNRTPSGSNSMNSNNFSIMDGKDEEENMVQEDELKNIFEVMSQASNQQSVKSVSAIALATNISIRCKRYMPKQASSLQLLKILLVLLNLGGLVTLLLTSQQYYEQIKLGGVAQSILDVYSYSIITLHSANILEQNQILNYPKKSQNASLMQDEIIRAYNQSFILRDQILQSVQRVYDSVDFPINPITGYNQSIINDLDQYVTELNLLVNGLELIQQNVNTDFKDFATRTLYLNTLDSLMQELTYRHETILEIYSMVSQSNDQDKDYQANTVIYAMVGFVISHMIVILFIVPFVKQINEIYSKVLTTLSRVTVEECQDEIKKLALCQHLLETNDDHWVTSNQVKLIFYNKSRDLDLNEKYKHAKIRKGNQYLSLRISDSSLTIWRDMAFYVSISGLSIAYLLLTSLLLQTQQATFNDFIYQYNQGVIIRSHVTSLISKLSITPERYLPTQIQSQRFMKNIQSNGALNSLLESLNRDTQLIQGFNQQSPLFIEHLNLKEGFSDTQQKINVNQMDFRNRKAAIRQESLIRQFNHLMKDNLCYYVTEDICNFQEQRDLYNNGLVGALDSLSKFVLDHQAMLMSQEPPSNIQRITNQYYYLTEFRDLIIQGNRIIFTSMNSMLSVMQEILTRDRTNALDRIQQLYLGLGIPLVIVTIILAGLEVIFLRIKVQRIIVAITFMPTFKFQDKIVLSLIKAILKL